MQVAAEHAQAVRERAGMSMEEGLLFDWIALHAADVSPRHQQASALVVADLADADGPVRQGTAVAAGNASQAAVRERFVQFTLSRLVRQHLSQSRHNRCPLYGRLARELRCDARRWKCARVSLVCSCSRLCCRPPPAMPRFSR